MDDGIALDAGGFSAWMAGIRAALDGRDDAAVPCGGCTACCTASQFVHIEPDETDTLAHIPGQLLFPAPRLPPGHVLLGYDEQGRCPMLTDAGCSIYEHRPRTCRTYDCRIFAATGLRADDGDETKAEIARRARRWRFTFPTDHDRRSHGAVVAAAASLNPERQEWPGPTTPVQRAVRALEIHEEFLP